MHTYPKYCMFHESNIVQDVKKNETTLSNFRDFSMPRCFVNSQAGIEHVVSQIYLSAKLFSSWTTVPQDVSLEKSCLRCNFEVNKVFFFSFSLSVSFKQGDQSLHIQMRAET